MNNTIKSQVADIDALMKDHTLSTEDKIKAIQQKQYELNKTIDSEVYSAAKNSMPHDEMNDLRKLYHKIDLSQLPDPETVAQQWKEWQQKLNDQHSDGIYEPPTSDDEDDKDDKDDKDDTVFIDNNQTELKRTNLSEMPDIAADAKQTLNTFAHVDLNNVQTVLQSLKRYRAALSFVYRKETIEQIKQGVIEFTPDMFDFTHAPGVSQPFKVWTDPEILENINQLYDVIKASSTRTKKDLMQVDKCCTLIEGLEALVAPRIGEQ